MSEHGSQQPRPAYCEEYSEETQATVPETRQSANVAAKRSKTDVAKTKSVRDSHSDSGYSSHTHSAPNSSLDSKLGTNPPITPDPPLINPEKDGSETKALQSRTNSPEKHPLTRTESKSRRDGASRTRQSSCDKCVSAARRGPVPIDPYGSANYVIAQPRHRVPVPPSPQPRRAAPLPEAILPPREEGPPRPATSLARPMSFHAGTMPEPMYLPRPTYMVERPSSARQTAYPFPPPSFPPPSFPPPPFPPQPAYFKPLPPPQPPPTTPVPQEYFAPMPLAYEVLPPARPRPRKMPTEQPPPRPQSMYYGSAPIYEYAEPMYKMIEPSQPLPRQLSRRSRRESLRASEPYADNDAHMMPPPPPPAPRADTKPRQGRPPMRHAATSANAYSYRDTYHRGGGYEAKAPSTTPRESRKGSLEEQSRSRRPSLARPSKTSEEKIVSFDEAERDMSRMNMEPPPSKTIRNSSMYGHESLEDLEGSVEAYLQHKGTVRAPVTAPSHDDPMGRLVRKKTNTDSEAGSRVSTHSRNSRGSREGSDAKNTSSPKALDHKSSNDVNARNENDRFALRFNPEGINVKMQGGIEGRAISLRKSKDGDGDMELSIGSRAGAESGRGRMGNTSNSSRPSLREKSRKRYSYIEGKGVQEISGPGYESTRSLSIARMQSPQDEDGGPRMIGERIMAMTRRRRSSRHGYDGERYEG